VATHVSDGSSRHVQFSTQRSASASALSIPAFSIQYSVFSTRHSAFSVQHSAFSIRHSNSLSIQHSAAFSTPALSVQHSAFSIQYSALSIQHSAPSGDVCYAVQDGRVPVHALLNGDADTDDDADIPKVFFSGSRVPLGGVCFCNTTNGGDRIRTCGVLVRSISIQVATQYSDVCNRYVLAARK
jgi:hypothetical protein